MTMIFLSVDVIEEVKVNVYEWMVRSIFDTSFFPIDEALVKTMVESALDDAIFKYGNGISFVCLHSSADGYKISRTR
jgi:hypothetical protein